jgi:hypothetical protein
MLRELHGRAPDCAGRSVDEDSLPAADRSCVAQSDNPEEEDAFSDGGDNNVIVREYVNQDSLLYYIGKGYTIYYLPKQEINNQQVYGVDISLYGAVPYN